MTAYGFCWNASPAANSLGYGKETGSTLKADGRSIGALCLYENHAQDSRITGPLDNSPTVSRKWGTGGNNTPLIIGFDSNKNAYVEQYGTLRAHESGGCNENILVRGYARRLIPMECERIQGCPDGWTDIGPWTDSKGKRHKESSDTARYTALGNSIALPFWLWLTERIAKYLPAGATLGSLFDGIGGFPLCWETVHGKGTARWASEIEEFPIAITRRRFGKEANADRIT